MGRIDEISHLRLAHLTGREVLKVAWWDRTTIVTRYVLYPIGLGRPAKGTVTRGVPCGTCKKTVQVTVASAKMTRLRRSILLAVALLTLIAAVLAIKPAVGLLILLVLIWVGATSGVLSNWRWAADGVRVARSETRKSRRTHSIRRPSNQARATTRPAPRPAVNRPPRRSSPPRPERPRPLGDKHPAYELRYGMDQATVQSRLGNPTKKGIRRGKEIWLYENVPVGYDTHVVIDDGTLASLEIAFRSTSQKSDIKIRIGKGGICAFTPWHMLNLLNATLTQAAPISSSRLQEQYTDLRHSWNSAPLNIGTPSEIRDLLQNDLKGDRQLPGFSEFLLMPMLENNCAQVVSIIDAPGQSFSSGIAYRVWFTDDGRVAAIRSKPRGSATRP